MTALQLESPEHGRRVVHWLLILGFFFAGYAIVLPWMQFDDGMETFNVLTSLEIARDGNWILPTLWQLPRLEKPPLAQWLTALGILAGGDIAFSARWVSLLVACLTLLVIYEWGRLLHSASAGKAGIVAALAAGSTILFMRFGKRAAYDGQLLFWDALANLAFTWGLFRGRWWWGTLLGGIALGLAMLTKGPAALLHTILPCALWAAGLVVYQQRRATEQPMPWGKPAMMLCGAVAIGTLIVLPWVIAVIIKMGGAQPLWALWRTQVTLSAEREEGLFTNPLHGLLFFALLAPWLQWVLCAGLVAQRDRQQERKLWFLLVLMALPVVIHAFMPVLRPRYLLPMLAPSAVIVGIAYCDYMKRSAKPHAGDHLALIAHYGTLLVLLVGYPLLAVRDAVSDGEPLPGLGWAWALVLAGIGLALVVPAMLLQRRRPMALPIVTALAMVLYNGTYTWHQHGGPNVSKEIIAELLQKYPDARFYGLRAKLPQRDFAIYLGRSVPAVDSVAHIPPGQQNMLFLRDDWKIQPPPGSVPAMRFMNRERPWTLWQLPAPVPARASQP